jgi:hypothetical protein
MQSRPLVGITERDRLAVADVERRNPGAVDEDAGAASIDGNPTGSGEAQQQIGLGKRRGWGGEAQAVQGDVAPVAIRHDHVAARGKDVPHRSDEDRER